MKGTGMIQPGKLDINVTKLKKGGETFEIIVDPDMAIAYRNKKEGVSIRDVVKTEKVFSDTQKGMAASENKMKEVFGTEDVMKVAEKILSEGEVHFTQAYREELQEMKRKRIVDIIHRNAIDPRTRLPHPQVRIENAMKEAKIALDMYKGAEEQIDDVIKRLRPILALKIELLEVQVTIPPQYAHQSYNILKKYGTIKKDVWGSDGSLVANLDLPAGLQEEFLDKLNNLTHGGVNMKVLKEK